MKNYHYPANHYLKYIVFLHDNMNNILSHVRNGKPFFLVRVAEKAAVGARNGCLR